MPAIIQGSSYSAQTLYDNTQTPINAPNPERNLRPDGKLHKRILMHVMSRAQASNNIMRKRFPSWRQMDETLTGFIHLSHAEELVKKKDLRKPVSIVFPYSYAILDTLLSYMDSMFLRAPIFRYEGNSPEDVAGAAMLEKLIETHSIRTKMNITLHTVFRDSLVYGVGAAFPMWKQLRGFQTRETALGSERLPVVLFEGNALDTVDPYNLLLDPVVGARDVQAGEFVGFLRTTNHMELLTHALDNPTMYNVEHLPKTGIHRSLLNDADSSGRQRRAGTTGSYATESGETSGVIDLIYMYMKVIPKDLGLSDSERPEKWLFIVAADRFVLHAEPINLDHNMFPVAIATPTFDGYSHTPLSKLELLSDIQTTVNWLFNSHITNVRKALNDMFIVDPYRVNVEDLRDPEPGKLIRMRRAAWGQDVRNAIHQFQVSDVTASHLNDSQILMSMMHKLSGADDAAMGALRQSGPERLTSAEFQGTRQGALGRMESLVRVIASQFMQDIAYMLASQTQQLMSEEVYIKTAGRWQDLFTSLYSAQISHGRMKIHPQDLLIDYDVTVLDPTSTGQNADMWLNLYQIINTQPELAAMYDMPKIFKHIANLLGAHDVEDFIKAPQPEIAPQMNSQLMPTEQVQQGMQAGNLVPLQEVADALQR